MITLKNHTILYDQDCPMCRVYTSAFINIGWLPKDGRVAYQNLPADVCKLINHQRAVDEIALVNTQSGEVTYGINSLFKIIGNAIPIFKPLFRFAPFMWIMRKFYAFVSYNRKVIVPAKIEANVPQPTFSLTYRVAYLVFTWFITGLILTQYAHLLTTFLPTGGALREYFICGGQMFFQGIIMFFYKKDKLWGYLGNMMTISFVGALLLTIPLIVASLIQIDPLFYLLFFLAVAGLMLLEHLRRCRLLEIGWVMSATWVLFRLLVLGMIFLT